MIKTPVCDLIIIKSHIGVLAKDVGLLKDSVILLEQIRTIDKTRLKEKMGHLNSETMNEVNSAIGVSFGLFKEPQDTENEPQGGVFSLQQNQTAT